MQTNFQKAAANIKKKENNRKLIISLLSLFNIKKTKRVLNELQKLDKQFSYPQQKQKELVYG